MTEIELKDYIDQQVDIIRFECKNRACSSSVLAQQIVERFQLQLSGMQERFDIRMTGTATGLEKAEAQLNKRLETMNEFRNALKDQANGMATRRELELAQRGFEDRIKILEISKAHNEGKTIVISSLLATFVSVIVGVMIRYAFK